MVREGYEHDSELTAMSISPTYEDDNDDERGEQGCGNNADMVLFVEAACGAPSPLQSLWYGTSINACLEGRAVRPTVLF